MTSATSDRNETLRLIRGIENGNLLTVDAYQIATNRDPVLVYFALRYIRERYPASHPNSTGVLARLVELTKTYPDVMELSRKGEKDVMREWFDDTHTVREFFGKEEEFVDLIVDKLEG